MLQKELDRHEIPLELVPSMEYRLIPETWPETLEKGWLLPWEGNHILIELPIHKASRIGNIVPEEEINKLLDMGYQPVLAHPERYLYLDDELYDMQGTDLHNEKYADFFDSFGFSIN